jgi:hypothetical protein
MIKIYKLLLGEMKRKEKEPKEGNVSNLKVGDNHLANSNSDVRRFGSHVMRNCTLPLNLITGTGFLAENIKETRCKLTPKFYKILCCIKGLKIC